MTSIDDPDVSVPVQITKMGDGNTSSSHNASVQCGSGSRKFSFDDFDIGRALGKGKFGTVYLAREKEHQFVVALKILFIDEVVKYNVIHQLKREIDIQYHLRHPNILRCYCYFREGNKISIVLEFAEKGNLYSLLKKVEKLTEEVTASYVGQISDALAYCHSKHVLHRDIKLENILIDGHGHVKLADFGWSVHDKKQGDRKTICGTVDYLPPEMISDNTCSTTVDNWAVGILMFECLTGKTPFQCKSQRDTLLLIKKCLFPMPTHFSPEAKDLLSKLLISDYQYRLGMKETATHDWVKKFAPNFIPVFSSGLMKRSNSFQLSPSIH